MKRMTTTTIPGVAIAPVTEVIIRRPFTPRAMVTQPANRQNAIL